MAHHPYINIIIACTLMVWARGGVSADLITIYELAKSNDPSYLAHTAAHRATLQSRPRALAQLLPRIDLSANTYYNEQSISTQSNFGSQGDIDFNSHGYRLSLSQPIYRHDRWIALKQSTHEIQRSAAALSRAQQDLILRIAERYFAVLAALDNISFADAEVAALAKQLEQAKQSFEVGLSAITDVQEAKAGYDLAIANQIQAQNALENAQAAIEEATGQTIATFSPLGEMMPLVHPEPQAIEHWRELALLQNFSVQATQYAADSARAEIKRQSAGRYPTVDLTGARSYAAAGGRFGDNQSHTSSIGLELNIPIYQGGLISTQIKTAHENYNVAIYRLEQERRIAERLTREAYLGVVSGISQVKALQQAVVSSETALASAEEGFKVGSRTAVDVVASQQNTSAAKRNYSRAKYQYILATIRLKLAVGTLSPVDIQLINGWLQ